MDDALRGLGLTTPQWGALITIAANEGISGADLARIRNITPQTVNTILQNLEHADLICRRHAPGNGTILLLELTAAGRARVDEARERIDPIQSRLFGPLSPMERVQLVDMLTRCCEAFRGEPTQGCPED
jgi:DNA-binding MarR family transcriptional regulator